MRLSGFRPAGIPLLLFVFSAACSPEATNGLYGPTINFPVETDAVLGFPWDKVDLSVADATGSYVGYVAPGDSVGLYFAMKSGSEIHPLQLDTARNVYWGVSSQSASDMSGTVIDYRGDSAVAVMERRENGRGVLKPRKSGYVLTPLARVVDRHSAAMVYACRAGDCVKVKIVSR